MLLENITSETRIYLVFHVIFFRSLHPLKRFKCLSATATALQPSWFFPRARVLWAFSGCLWLLQSAACTNASRRWCQTLAGAHFGGIVKSPLNILPSGQYRTIPQKQDTVISIFYIGAFTDRQGRPAKDKIAQGSQQKTILIPSASLIFLMVGAGSSTAQATGISLPPTCLCNIPERIYPDIISFTLPVERT